MKCSIVYTMIMLIFGVLHPFHNYLSHVETMEGVQLKALFDDNVDL